MNSTTPERFAPANSTLTERRANAPVGETSHTVFHGVRHVKLKSQLKSLVSNPLSFDFFFQDFNRRLGAGSVGIDLAEFFIRLKRALLLAGLF
jgi:hypothetical protein